MALPKLNTPLYELELPSTGEKIKYRPFLVKEQKNLMIAMESEEATQMKECLASIISSCTFAKVDPYRLPMFDIEYLFLRFRGKSVGEKITLNLTCPDDNETTVETDINLEEVDVQLQADHTNIIPLTDTVKMIMRYPDLNDMGELDATEDDNVEVESIFKIIKRCVHEIHDGDTIHNKVDISDGELEEFIENLTTDAFDKVQTFFDTMPKVRHVVKVKNPKTKKTGEVVIEGIQNFFA
tara:strand:- start:344 stop:1060 length:717 start_codon:yes stop_codon:yes gene_type:complete